MSISQDRRRSYAARQVGTLALSQVQIEGPMAAVRAAAAFNSMARLGIHVPFFLVHDLAILLTIPKGLAGWSIGPRGAAIARIRPPQQVQSALERYREFLKNVSESDVVEKLAGWRLRDDLVAVLLTRALGDIYHRWREPGKSAGVEELPLDLAFYSDVDPAIHFLDFEPQALWAFTEHLAQNVLHIYTSIELIDLDTVRLLGLFKEDTAHGSDAIGGALELVDLFSALGSPEANDIANFSLDLLPSVLETKRSSGAQTFAVDGYTSVERKGNVDSLMLSELAYDQEIFEQKVVDQELLYFGHERQREDERRLHYILVDASASMRGTRQVFARGLALTLVKKLTLQGDEIWLRFFDSRLHELCKMGRGAQVPVPYLLSFRSEHGRNYGKVFRQLVVDVTKLRREQHRNLVLYVITHGQCHISPDLVSALAQQAHLYGIIILPSSEVSLDYLQLMHRTQIVESTSLSNRSERKDRALNIVDDATARAATEDEAG